MTVTYTAPPFFLLSPSVFIPDLAAGHHPDFFQGTSKASAAGRKLEVGPCLPFCLDGCWTLKHQVLCRLVCTVAIK